MKKTIYIIALLIAAFTSIISGNSLQAQGSALSDTVVMGASYANEIYYSMQNGKILASPRNTWDIAFRTMLRSSSILTNDGSGVVLYTYPKSDTSGWAGMDTTGFKTWTPMYNDVNDWENGAFSRNAKGYPDYGWGIYNSVSHDLNGDSLFIIQLRDGSLRKLWIKDKHSVQDIYHFRFANLDGTNDHTDTLNLANDLATDFVGFSLETNQRVNFQPPASSWDLVFTKYMSIQPGNVPYPAMAVLSNPDTRSKKFHPVPLTYTNWQVGPWDSLRSSIGWDWKVFSTSTMTYKVVDSLVYFIKPVGKDVYKLFFTSFAGGTTGAISFQQEKVLAFSINEHSSSGLSVKVYPNPVSDKLNLLVTANNSGELHIVLSDLSGRQLGADHPVGLSEGLNQFSIDVTGFKPGVYFLTASTADTKAVTKVIITR